MRWIVEPDSSGLQRGRRGDAIPQRRHGASPAPACTLLTQSDAAKLTGNTQVSAADNQKLYCQYLYGEPGNGNGGTAATLIISVVATAPTQDALQTLAKKQIVANIPPTFTAAPGVGDLAFSFTANNTVAGYAIGGVAFAKGASELVIWGASSTRSGSSMASDAVTIASTVAAQV